MELRSNLRLGAGTRKLLIYGQARGGSSRRRAIRHPNRAIRRICGRLRRRRRWLRMARELARTRQAADRARGHERASGRAWVFGGANFAGQEPRRRARDRGAPAHERFDRIRRQASRSTHMKPLCRDGSRDPMPRDQMNRGQELRTGRLPLRASEPRVKVHFNFC
jgi:hypothetical protein